MNNSHQICQVKTRQTVFKKLQVTQVIALKKWKYNLSAAGLSLQKQSNF